MAPTPSTHSSYTQLKEDPSQVQTGPTTNKKAKKKKAITSWDVTLRVLGNGSLFVSILLCATESSQEANRCKLNQKREREI